MKNKIWFVNFSILLLGAILGYSVINLYSQKLDNLKMEKSLLEAQGALLDMLITDYIDAIEEIEG